MLCFVCLTENREPASKSVTFVQGTAVCREHVTSVGASDLMSLSYKIKEAVSARMKQNQNGVKKDWAKTPVADLSDHDDGEAENS